MLIILRPVKKLCLLFFILLLVGVRASAQTASYGELQAAYLYNFAKYTKCPVNIPILHISILGETEITEEIQEFMLDKKILGNYINLRVIQKADEIAGCEIVFLASSESFQLSALLKATANKNVLIVTEDDLAANGAPFSFFIDDEKLRFKINKTALIKSQMEVAEGLIKLGVLLPDSKLTKITK